MNASIASFTANSPALELPFNLGYFLSTTSTGSNAPLLMISEGETETLFKVV